MTLKQIFIDNIDWKYVLKLFLILRVVTFASAIIGYNFIPFKPTYPYWDAILSAFGHQLFWTWAGFDGVHYLMLAEKGYIYGLTEAYFPAYFLLIRLITFITHNRLLSGLIISHTFFILSLGMFYKLVKLDFSQKITKKTLLFLTLFPTSFYFLSVYTESLFLFLILTFFYLLRKKQFWFAGIFGAFASATRLIGIFLVLSFIYFIYQENKELLEKKKLKLKTLISKFWMTIIPAFGLLSYMFFLWQKYQDPFKFAHVQEDFGAGRKTDKLILIYQVFWRYLKMIFTIDKSNPIYFTTWLEFIATILFIGLLIYGFTKKSKIKIEYLIFSTFSLFLPTLTGILSSMPRYVLTLFPGFISLALLTKNTFIARLYLFISLIFLIICTALFTRGFWIA